MKFHLEFTYQPQVREKLLRLLESDGLSAEGVTIKGAWVAAQTGFGYAIVEADDVKPLHDLCAAWSEYGQVDLTPLISVKSL